MQLAESQLAQLVSLVAVFVNKFLNHVHLVIQLVKLLACQTWRVSNLRFQISHLVHQSLNLRQPPAVPYLTTLTVSPRRLQIWQSQSTWALFLRKTRSDSLLQRFKSKKGCLVFWVKGHICRGRLSPIEVVLIRFWTCVHEASSFVLAWVLIFRRHKRIVLSLRSWLPFLAWRPKWFVWRICISRRFWLYSWRSRS